MASFPVIPLFLLSLFLLSPPVFFLLIRSSILSYLHLHHSISSSWRYIHHGAHIWGLTSIFFPSFSLLIFLSMSHFFFLLFSRYFPHMPYTFSFSSSLFEAAIPFLSFFFPPSPPFPKLGSASDGSSAPQWTPGAEIYTGRIFPGREYEILPRVLKAFDIQNFQARDVIVVVLVVSGMVVVVVVVDLWMVVVVWGGGGRCFHWYGVVLVLFMV